VRPGLVTLFLCGDVMLGRGVDQILPYPGSPELRERYVEHARVYVDLAEAVSGPIPFPVDFGWPWGTALEPFCDVRIMNLETSITVSNDFALRKGVHYRMNPRNIPCLLAAKPDVCVLANNHVLDFGRSGLEETLDVLSAAGVRVAGAGRDAARAKRPAVGPLADGRRVVVLSAGATSSGIPLDWAAGDYRSGVDVVPVLSDDAAGNVLDRVRAAKQPGDLAVVSIHWGTNWGYDIPAEQVRFAHQLVDGGVDVVHGHSSHHPRGIEVYRRRLILYGCGDFVNDYEGIRGHQPYRPDLRLAFYATLAEDGTLSSLRMIPMRTRKMRLEKASVRDAQWLRHALERGSRPFRSRFERRDDGAIELSGES
jgi:poly-gamma-glutamate capsule biosynthesis protein CapA/YwtB (metallophosphatase superfamily)